jgi:hypothetical protein
MMLGIYIADRFRSYIYVLVRNMEYYGEHMLQTKINITVLYESQESVNLH